MDKYFSKEKSIIDIGVGASKDRGIWFKVISVGAPIVRTGTGSPEGSSLHARISSKERWYLSGYSCHKRT